MTLQIESVDRALILTRCELIASLIRGLQSDVTPPSDRVRFTSLAIAELGRLQNTIERVLEAKS